MPLAGPEVFKKKKKKKKKKNNDNNNNNNNFNSQAHNINVFRW